MLDLNPYTTGRTIKVLDESSFYAGREAVIKDAVNFGSGYILTVAIPSGAGGEISFAIREENAALV